MLSVERCPNSIGYGYLMSATDQVIVRRAEEGDWYRFRNPLEVLATSRPGDVGSILDLVEKEVENKGLFAAGFVAYEAAPAFDPALRCRTGGDFPLLWFGLFKKAEPFAFPALKPSAVWTPEWKSSVTREEYRRAIRAVKEYIFQGATYQVNYSYRLDAPFAGAAREYFFQVAGGRNIPYAAFVETGRYAICSFSPELFFDLRRGVISSKPMKGTMPRGFLQDDDLANSLRLYRSEKDRAENIMIVDMVRNDIGRIAAAGTVKACSLFDVEKYDTVWQMTSTVTGVTSASLFEIFKALFPPASCTGAPKAETMRIIAGLETRPRNIYTGCIGFLAPGRRAQFNVAIRTVLIDKLKGGAEYGVGGGIVWDSVDASEYDECAVKARVVCESPADFSLLETFLWTPAEGVFLPDLHIARMKSSAHYFGFEFDEKSARKRIDAFVSGLPFEPHRVRMLLARDGGLSFEKKLYSPDRKKPLVCLAKHPVESGSIFLYHKTTNRPFYEQARAMRPGYDEVILWNEKGEVTEFCTANIVVELDGELLTPPVSCGLLPGTYRAWLLKKKKIKERVIETGTLRLCRRIYLCNSVRKMQEVGIDLKDYKVNRL